MSTTVHIRAVNDWQKTLGEHLTDALNASVNVCGRTGAQACIHAIILMAQSARAMAKKAKKLREVHRDNVRGPFVYKWRQGKSEPSLIFKWQFDPETKPPYKLDGAWDNAKHVPHSRLAQRSWMWGLKDFRAPVIEGEGGKPIAGVAMTKILLSEKMCGVILTNKLSYIQQAMPAGWLSMVHELAANKILKQAALRMQSKFVRLTKHMSKSDQTTLAQAFSGGLNDPSI